MPIAGYAYKLERPAAFSAEIDNDPRRGNFIRDIKQAFDAFQKTANRSTSLVWISYDESDPNVFKLILELKEGFELRFLVYTTHTKEVRGLYFKPLQKECKKVFGLPGMNWLNSFSLEQVESLHLIRDNG